jgi:hypothetical protein
VPGDDRVKDLCGDPVRKTRLRIDGAQVWSAVRHNAVLPNSS